MTTPSGAPRAPPSEQESSVGDDFLEINIHTPEDDAAWGKTLVDVMLSENTLDVKVGEVTTERKSPESFTSSDPEPEPRDSEAGDPGKATVPDAEVLPAAKAEPERIRDAKAAAALELERLQAARADADRLHAAKIALAKAAAAELEVVDGGVRQRAVEQLMQMGDVRAVSALVPRLEDQSWRIRRAAVQALAQVVKNGNGHERTIQSITERLQDDSWRVRQAAVQALVPIVDRGDERAVQKVFSRLTDEDGDVRKASVEAFAVIVRRGHQRVINAVLQRFQSDTDSDVRSAAERVLAPVLDVKKAEACQLRSHQDSWASTSQSEDDGLDSGFRRATEDSITSAAIVSVGMNLQDPERVVRRGALQTLPDIVKRGDERAIALAAARLHDDDPSVRQAAMRALSEVAKKGDARAIAAVTAQLEDSGSGVRQAAVEALTEVAGKGDAHAVAAVAARLEHADSCVRRSAVQAFAQVIGKGDASAIAALAARLEDEDTLVRQAAILALPSAAERGSEQTINTIIARLTDADEGIRRAAVQALAASALKGDKKIIAALTSSSKDGDKFVRHAAVIALAEVAEKGDDHALEAVSACLLDADTFVRKAAVQALAKVAERGDMRAITAVAARLEEEDEDERQVGGLENEDELDVSTVCGTSCSALRLPGSLLLDHLELPPYPRSGQNSYRSPCSAAGADSPGKCRTPTVAGASKGWKRGLPHSGQSSPHGVSANKVASAATKGSTFKALGDWLQAAAASNTTKHSF